MYGVPGCSCVPLIWAVTVFRVVPVFRVIPVFLVLVNALNLRLSLTSDRPERLVQHTDSFIVLPLLKEETDSNVIPAEFRNTLKNKKKRCDRRIGGR